MYGTAQPGMFEVEIAHGRADHGEHLCYRRQHLISSFDGSWLSTFGFLVRARLWLNANAHRYDVMHCLNIFEVDLRPALLAESLGLPAVMVPANHQAGLVPSNSRWRRFMALHEKRRKGIARVSAVVALSRHIERELVDAGVTTEKVHHIPLGVDVDRFHPAGPGEKARLRNQLNVRWQFVILFVGEVSGRKRPDWIIAGLRQLKEAGIDAGLLIVGPIKDQDYWNRFEQETVRAGLKQLVEWRGFVDDIERFHRLADVFVLPSQNEGLPNAMLEACASGVPSLCTPISGCVDVLGDGRCGQLVGSPPELASALHRYATRPGDTAAAGRAARILAEKEFALPIIAGRYHELFGALAGSKGQRV
jgi:glycosyltransferase involved in cell wall biosynthesis